MVGQDHIVGNRNEQRRNRGYGLAPHETREKTEVAGLAACQGLERAAMILCNAGGHGGCLPGGGAGGPFSGRRVRPDDVGPDLLKASCGHAETNDQERRAAREGGDVPIPNRIDTAGVSCYL